MGRKLPNFLRDADEETVLATAERRLDAAPSPAKRRAAHLDMLLLETGLLLGLRVSELVKLRVEHVDQAKGSALIYQGKGSHDRYVPVPTWFLPTLAAWIGERTTGLVFRSPRGGQLSARTVERRFAALGRAAGLPRKLKPHTLRHTYATRLLAKGANIREVQELLGHASVATTEIYTHVEIERLRAVADLL
jgi:site-specific recombinase XerD